MYSGGSPKSAGSLESRFQRWPRSSRRRSQQLETCMRLAEQQYSGTWSFLPVVAGVADAEAVLLAAAAVDAAMAMRVVAVLMSLNESDDKAADESDAEATASEDPGLDVDEAGDAASDAEDVEDGLPLSTLRSALQGVQQAATILLADAVWGSNSP
eukprot:360471-Chlamydomonas_euryale.AAC.5